MQEYINRSFAFHSSQHHPPLTNSFPNRFSNIPSISNIKAIMPPKRGVRETSEAPKRATRDRAAKIGTGDPGTYTVASQSGKDVDLHDSSDKPIATDFKLTYPLLEICRNEHKNRESF
jgi:hypothetical protein